MEPLHKFEAVHIDEDCLDVSGQHENELFFNCVFKKLNGLTLKGCDLNRSRLLTDSVQDALGFTVTLDCNSFENVELSPLLFDLLLSLAAITTGNDLKRKQLIDVIGRKRFEALRRVLKQTE